MAAATRHHPPNLLASSSPVEAVADHQALPYIPDNLILDILSRLPAKSVLRFRSVCKAWLATLSSRRFVDAHLEFSATARPTKLIVPVEYPRSESARSATSLWMGFYKYDTIGGDEAELVHGERFSPANGVAPWLKPLHCDGVLLVCTRRQGLMLCNPSTREFVSLVRETEGILACHHTVGFGRDPTTNAYKVVRLFYRRTRGTPANCFSCRVEVLTLGTCRWRRVAVPPYLIGAHPVSVHVRGFIYWSTVYGSQPGDSFVFARFSLADETFGVTPYPPSNKWPAHVCLAEWEGELCCVYVSAPAESAEIWACNGAGSEQVTWTLRFTIRLPQDTVVPSTRGFLKPPKVTFHGKNLLLRGAKKLYWYNVETQEMKKVAVALENLKYYHPEDSHYLQRVQDREEKMAAAFHIVNYAESLVRIRGESTETTLMQRVISVLVRIFRYTWSELVTNNGWAINSMVICGILLLIFHVFLFVPG